MKKKKFPKDVARFFHPEKSGSNANPETGSLVLTRKRKHGKKDVL